MPRGLCNTPGGMELRAQAGPPLKWPGASRIGRPSRALHGVLARLRRLCRLRLNRGFDPLSDRHTETPGRMPRGLCQYARRDGAAGAGRPTSKMAWGVPDRTT